MPSDDHAVPPPRRRPLGRGGAQGATGAASTTDVPPTAPPCGGPSPTRAVDRPAGQQEAGGTAPAAPDGAAGFPRAPEPSDAAAPEAHGAAGYSWRASAEDAFGAPSAAPGAADEPEPGGPPRAVVPAARAAAETEPVAEEPDAEDGRFTVVLDNFEGPFDLLLQLISKHKMDVTEVALSRVTDEFMAHIRGMGPDWDLDQTTEFLVVAATLLDLKAARLLPAAEVEDEADLALLEARDLLFARLLQYRAYKQVADVFADRLASESHRHPRTVGLEPHHAELLPEVILSIGAEGFAKLAVKAMQAKPKPQVYVDHIHAPLVSVREQAEIIVARLRTLGAADFAALAEDAADTLTVVARFLALLELYRERAVSLDQEDPLGTLTVRWCGDDESGADPVVTDEFDQETAPAQPEEGAIR